MQKLLSSNKQITQKTKTKKEIAIELNISLSTLRRWLKKADLSFRRGLYSPDEQAIIYEKLGFKSLTRNDAK